MVLVNLNGGTLDAEATFSIQHGVVRMKGRQTIMSGCCAWC